MIYVVTTGDSMHGWSVFGATTDAEEAERMAEAGDRWHHQCFGGSICQPNLLARLGEYRGLHARIQTFEEGLVPRGARELLA